MLDMPTPHLEQLINQQYQLQESSYKTHWPEALAFIVQYQGQSIGKIIVHEERGLLHFVDLALIAGARGKGYGTAILSAFLDLADKDEARLRLAVNRSNLRAKKLYLTLGFQTIETSDFYETMIRVPSVPKS